MGLSIFTSGAAMSSTNALNKSNSILSTAMERLGTGKRINSAADDAAGLQIATRLQGQVNGMSVAQRNVSDATAMLQTAEGAFDEVTNILYRMKDLATQSANATNSDSDRAAIQGEVDQLNSELKNILTNTKFGGESLIFSSNNGTFDPNGGKLGAEMSFQIGASAEETLKMDLSPNLEKLGNTFGLSFDPDDAALTAPKTAVETTLAAWEKAKGEFAIADAATSDAKKTAMVSAEKAYNAAVVDLKAAKSALPGSDGVAAIDLNAADDANAAITTISNAIESVGTVRSSLGANINRLGHTAANLSNMKDNTTLALGNIRDADFATEATNMTRNQMLAQTSMSMLKQANSMSGMVMSLLG
ncbi:flagellin [uncultured Leclercia sp.]|uniref:flagellin N-terminal helical domain-containing protein n=1 Tax=uncultured Leclercia sp. TaxID=332959 RepID=UPI002592B542|nr:flagellin [uncultured Leclercia sp.]